MILISTKKHLPNLKWRDNGQDSDTDRDSDDNWTITRKVQKRSAINIKASSTINP